MKEEYKPETVDSKFMKNMKKKFNTKQKDEIKVETQTMNSILKDIAQVPDKLHMTGSPGKPSAKPVKDGENPLQTGSGKQKFDSTMNKSY